MVKNEIATYSCQITFNLSKKNQLKVNEINLRSWNTNIWANAFSNISICVFISIKITLRSLNAIICDHMIHGKIKSSKIKIQVSIMWHIHSQNRLIINYIILNNLNTRRKVKMLKKYQNIFQKTFFDSSLLGFTFILMFLQNIFFFGTFTFW